jgi:hypothetical protein
MAGNMAVCGSSPASSPGGRRLSAAGGRAVIAGKCNTLPIFRGGGITYVSRGADYAMLVVAENPGGQSTTRCGGMAAGAAGRRP